MSIRCRHRVFWCIRMMVCDEFSNGWLAGLIVISVHKTGLPPRLDRSTSSDLTFAQVKKWFHDCEKHEKCRHLHTHNGFTTGESDVEAYSVPTRLLDVRGENTSIVRLVETRDVQTGDHGDYGRYTTLRYVSSNPHVTYAETAEPLLGRRREAKAGRGKSRRLSTRHTGCHAAANLSRRNPHHKAPRRALYLD